MIRFLARSRRLQRGFGSICVEQLHLLLYRSCGLQRTRVVHLADVRGRQVKNKGINKYPQGQEWSKANPEPQASCYVRGVLGPSAHPSISLSRSIGLPPSASGLAQRLDLSILTVLSKIQLAIPLLCPGHCTVPSP